MKLASDIKRYISKNVYKKAFPLVAIDTAMLICILFYKDRFIESDRGLIVALLIVTVPLLYTKALTVFSRFTWHGTVTDISCKSVMEYDACNRRYMNNRIYVTVKKDNGSTVKVRYKDNYKRVTYSAVDITESDVNVELDRISVGDRAISVWGLDKLVIVSSKNNNVNCAVCGAVNSLEHEQCYNCEHTLVKD